MLAFFNIPIRHEDHVARAISAANQIQQAVPDINVKLGGEDLLRVGIGITTGIGYTANLGSDDCKDYTIMGDVVNIGSRLQGLAGPGEILVSREVYDAVNSDYPDAQERTLEVKGISDPVRAFVLS